MKILVASLALLALAASANAEGLAQPNSSYMPTAERESLTDTADVDPFTGGLNLRYDDVVMPGNGGMDIVVVRSYASNVVAGTSTKPFIRTYANSRSGAGVGWAIQVAPRISIQNVRTSSGSWARPNALERLCTGGNANNYNNAYAMFIHMPDGQQMPLYGYQPGIARTKENWQATCANWIVTLKDPTGNVYTLENAAKDASGNPKIPLPGSDFWSGDNPNEFTFHTVLVTTQKTDRNGNWIRVRYDPQNLISPNYVEASDGRWVSLRHADVIGATTPQITSITTSAGHTWRYEHIRLAKAAVAGVSAFYVLSKVTFPTTETQTYEYYDGPFTFGSGDFAGHSRLKSRTERSGGRTSYTYQHYRYTFTYGGPNWSMGDQSDTFRVVQVQYSPTGGNRLYTYVHGGLGEYDTTTMTTEGGTTTYKYFGSGYNWNGYSSAHTETTWRVGLLAERHTDNIRSEYYSYYPVETAPYPSIIGGGIEPQSDSKVWRGVVSRYRVVSNGATFTTDRSNFDSFGSPQLVVETGPNGGLRTTAYTYLNDTAIWVIGKPSNESISGVGSILRTWDTRANMLSESRFGVLKEFEYHPTGDILRVRNARRIATTYLDYFRGKARQEQQAEGVTLFRTVNEDGTTASETNGEGHTTRYEYDGLKRVTRVIPPIGLPTETIYTATTKTVTRGAARQVTTFDSFGRPTTIDNNGVVATTTWDSLGRKQFVSILGFPSIGKKHRYDALNRLIRISHTADGSFRTLTYSNSAGVPTVAIRDERGLITTHRYRGYGDPDDLLLMQIDAPIADASVVIERNGRGLVTTVTQSGKTRRFDYDSRYYLTSATHPETGVTSYGRDELGNMTSRQVGTSGVSVFEYDGRNRAWRVTYPNGNPSQVTNTYTKTDRLKTVGNAVSMRRYGYDANQNVTSEVIETDGLVLSATYNYNGNDHLESIAYPVLQRTAYLTPNTHGRPVEIRVPAGTMLQASYWPNGQIYDVAFAGGSRATYQQNSREWPSGVTVSTPGGTVISSNLTFDVSGNVLSVSDSVDPAYNRSMSYDALNRLSTVQGPWGAGSVTYDGANNILTQTYGVETRSHSYDGNNRLASVTSSGPGTSSFTVGYDVYGNVTSAEQSYSYDNANNLTAGEGWQFTYDGQNKRIKTVRNGVTVYEFRSVHGQLLAEWQKRPGYYDVLKEHMFLAGREFAEQQTEFIGADVRPATWTFLQPDVLGSPISGISSGGALLFKENYHAFGRQIAGTAAGYTKRAFAGHQQATPTMIHMEARFYNPIVGRFLSIDPKEADAADLHSLNRYAYANNNPLRFVDPDGHSVVDVLFLAADTWKLGFAMYTGVGVGAAAADFGMSVLGVLSPVPGTGQALKALRTADKVVDTVKTADKAADAARGGAKLEKTTEKAAHGNKVDERPATLYEKYDKDGKFQKHGITKHEDPTKRYTAKEIDGGTVVRTDRGPRTEMVKKERELVETNPGPQNREPWAGKRSGE